jgi:gliding motility-associated-like protein
LLSLFSTLGPHPKSFSEGDGFSPSPPERAAVRPILEFSPQLKAKQSVFLPCMKRGCFVFILLLNCMAGLSQKIVDPCFISVEELGFFYGSDYMQNFCGDCGDERNKASDLMEWNSGTNHWDGSLPITNVDLPPPPDCNIRALWMGRDKDWTRGGEGIALRLDYDLVVGKTYTYKFTYASNGLYSDHNFSPWVYTAPDPPILFFARKVGRLPAVDGWKTNSFSFTATKEQAQAHHHWLILLAIESSGIVLSNCMVEDPIENNEINNTTFCIGDSVTIKAAAGKFLEYQWNTGSDTSSVKVGEAGTYAVKIQQYTCTSEDSVSLNFIDCEVRLDMPNVFTPNGDMFNEIFKPRSFNYIASGKMQIYNRWEKEIYTGDLFEGWNGDDHGIDASSGVYYYLIEFTNKDGKHYTRKGPVTLVR